MNSQRRAPGAPLFLKEMGKSNMTIEIDCEGRELFDTLTPEQLPDDWPQRKKEEFCADDAQRKEAAKKIMIVMVPILLIVAVDMLYLLIDPLLASV